MLDLEKFGQILREARERKNLTCRDVGQALDLAPSYYRSMEKGRHCPRLHRAIQICALLDISFDDMARKCCTPPPRSASPDETEEGA